MASLRKGIPELLLDTDRFVETANAAIQLKNSAGFLSMPKKKPQISGVFGPVEMCELSELSELSPQDAVGSLSAKGRNGGIGLFFEETQGLGHTILSGGSLFNHL
ncbi:MAG TPA: hypothetical protein VNV63_00820 [Nitrospiria bacterium]|nr:hypothetical protein [Nitrospiria bacterium]